MAKRGTSFQKGGGGTNFEQYIQAAFITTLAIRGNAPCIPTNEIEEIVLQGTNRGWFTEDILVIAKSDLGNHQLLIQAKHNIVFSADDKVFQEVIKAFWLDFNNDHFIRSNDRLIIAKSRLNNLEKNHIKGLLNYAKTHSSYDDFISEVNGTKEKKERLQVFQEVLKMANNNAAVTDDTLWRFLTCIDVLGYDFINEGSVDETYFLNLIKLSKSSSVTATESEIWAEIIKYVTLNNPTGGSITKTNVVEKEFYKYFDVTRLNPVYESIRKLSSDSKILLDSIKNKLGNSSGAFHLQRTDVIERIRANAVDGGLTIITGKAGVGKSAAIKDACGNEWTLNSYVFRADQFNRPHLANVLSDVGIQNTITEVFYCLSLLPDKLVFIDSLEKLLENSDPENAFKDLLSVANENGINIIATCRKYAVDLLIQKYELEKANVKVFEVPDLTDKELQTVVKEFPVLQSSLDNERIRELLRRPKYLEFTLRSINSSSDGFAFLSESQFKAKLWETLICNAVHRQSGLPAKREKAFMDIAVNRAKQMMLFVRPTVADEEAVDILESDDIIFQERKSRRYAPSHDILEDWALVKYVNDIYEENQDISKFFPSLGNEPAIRRAFRLWLEDALVDNQKKVQKIVQECLQNSTIKKYWIDELLTALFKAEKPTGFFSVFEKQLLKDDAVFLVSCLELIQTSCKEANYEVADQRILLPVGVGWYEALLFIKGHVAKLDVQRTAIHSFLSHWEYRLVFQRPKNQDELVTVRDVIFYYLDQIEKADDFWQEYSLERTNEQYQNNLLSILYTLAPISKERISSLIIKSLEKVNEKGNWRLRSFHKLVLEKFLSGIRTEYVAYHLPDLIISTAQQYWKFTPPVFDESDDSITRILGKYLDDDHCWGIEHRFDFFPSGIRKTIAYNLLCYHPTTGIKFITEFLNYCVDFYVTAECRFKHELTQIEVRLNSGVIIKQWASPELWMAYRGLRPTHDLIECLLMSLEKYLFELADQQNEGSKQSLKLCYNYLLSNSNSVLITGVLASVAIAYPTVVEEEMLPLVSIKELYSWEILRAREEHGALAPYDMHIVYAQKIRYEWNQLPHRKKYQRGFAEFLLDYQVSIKTINQKLWDILDILWKEASEDDIVWRKTLNEIDGRKWAVTTVDAEKKLMHIQPEYEEKVKDFIEQGKEENELTNRAAEYSQLIRQAFDRERPMIFVKWNELYQYYSSLNSINVLIDRPVTFAVVGLRDFSKELNGEQLSWCIEKVANTLTVMARHMNSLFRVEGFEYNIMEKEIALESFHLIFSQLTDEEEFAGARFVMLYVMVARFQDYEIERFTKYLRTVFSNVHPAIAKQIWRSLVQFSKFKKKHSYYYDDPDQERLDTAINKELSYLQKITRVENNTPVNSNKYSFGNTNPHFLYVALLFIPAENNDKEYKEFTQRFLELYLKDHAIDEDTVRKRSSIRKFSYRMGGIIEKYLAELILSGDLEFSKSIISTLTNAVYESLRSRAKYDVLNTVNQTLNNVIYRLVEALEKNEQASANIERFWLIWQYLYEIILDSKKINFTHILLFDTEMGWPENKDHFEVFDGRKQWYRMAVEVFGANNLRSIMKVMSTVGRKEFLPDGLSWIVELLQKYPDQMEAVETNSCDRLVHTLYHKHINQVKNDQRLLTQLIWLLDKMIEHGNSSAYLIREDVISYKKMN